MPPTAKTAEKNETAKTVETPAENSAPAFDPATLDEFGQQFVARTSSQVEKLNALRTEIKASSTDKNEIQDAAYESLKNANVPDGFKSDTVTPEVLAEYDAIVKREVELSMILRKAAEEYAEVRATQGQDAEKLAKITAEADALDKKIRQARSLLATEYPGAETLLPDVVRVGKSGGGSGKGTGGRKLRGFTVSVDGNVAYLGKDENKKSSFAAAATVLGIPTPELQRVYFENVGTDDVEKLPAEATFTIKGADDKEHNVKAVKNA